MYIYITILKIQLLVSADTHVVSNIYFQNINVCYLLSYKKFYFQPPKKDTKSKSAPSKAPAKKKEGSSGGKAKKKKWSKGKVRFDTFSLKENLHINSYLCYLI